VGPVRPWGAERLVRVPDRHGVDWQAPPGRKAGRGYASTHPPVVGDDTNGKLRRSTRRRLGVLLIVKVC
jgi:hypothetical protein